MFVESLARSSRAPVPGGPGLSAMPEGASKNLSDSKRQTKHTRYSGADRAIGINGPLTYTNCRTLAFHTRSGHDAIRLTPRAERGGG